MRVFLGVGAGNSVALVRVAPRPNGDLSRGSCPSSSGEEGLPRISLDVTTLTLPGLRPNVGS